MKRQESEEESALTREEEGKGAEAGNKWSRVVREAGSWFQGRKTRRRKVWQESEIQRCRSRSPAHRVLLASGSWIQGYCLA